jgi:hypothetical protein
MLVCLKNTRLFMSSSWISLLVVLVGSKKLMVSNRGLTHISTHWLDTTVGKCICFQKKCRKIIKNKLPKAKKEHKNIIMWYTKKNRLRNKKGYSTISIAPISKSELRILWNSYNCKNRRKGNIRTNMLRKTSTLNKSVNHGKNSIWACYKYHNVTNVC